ncbi:MAG: Phosphoserine phosphatase, partial [uncultured Sphingomonas sp.]
ERPCNLRHGPDGDAAGDLHAVPAALRVAAGAVAAPLPAARAAVDAGLRRQADRPGEAQGDQPPAADRPLDPSARAEAAGGELRRPAGREQHSPGRPRRHRPRQGARPAGGDGDRQLPALRRRDRRAAGLRRRDRDGVGDRPGRARAGADRRRELLRRRQAQDDRGVGGEVRPARPSWPRPLLLGPRQRRARLRVERRAGGGEPARAARPPGGAARLAGGGLGL